MNRAFCCWSGGKESAMALYRAKMSGITVERLLNMVTEDGGHSRTHGIEARLLHEQALSAGIQLIQRRTTWNGYEGEFKKALLEFREQGMDRGIFGDIDLAEHREWVERVCSEVSVRPSLPLWLEQREKLLNEFIDAGFKAVIVTVDRRFLDETWVGREINAEFVKDIKKFGNRVDICGECGEYHSFVYDGPIFHRPVPFVRGGTRADDGYIFLNIHTVSSGDGP